MPFLARTLRLDEYVALRPRGCGCRSTHVRHNAVAVEALMSTMLLVGAARVEAKAKTAEELDAELEKYQVRTGALVDQ